MAVLNPSEIVERIYKRVPGHIRRTFAATFILGLIIHLFMLTNKLPNPDDLGQLIDHMHRPNSGRWFQFFPAAISSNFSMPAVNGVLAILYISIAACLIAALFRITQTTYCILLGAVMVSFPTVASTLGYMNAADAYAFSLLLACLAAMVADKYTFGFLFAIPLLTLSLGVYQAYFGVAAALMVSVLILRILQNQNEIREIIIQGVKFLAALLLGLLAYLLMVRLTATNLTDYMGISDMGSIALRDLPGLVLGAYRNAFDFFFRNAFSFHLPFMKAVFFAAALAALSLVLILVVKREIYKSLTRLALLIVLLAVLPLAANIIYVMAKEQVHLLMIYGLVVLFGLALALVAEVTTVVWDKPVFHYWTAGGSIIVCLTVLLSSYNYALVSNQAYLKLNMVYEQGYAYTNRLISRIQAAPDYDDDMDIIFIGEATLPPGGLTDLPREAPESRRKTVFKPITGMEFVEAPQLSKIAGLTNGITTSTFNLKNFMHHYLGFNQPFEVQKAEQLDEELALVVAEMAVYPDDGSIVVIEDQILIKFSEID